MFKELCTDLGRSRKRESRSNTLESRQKDFRVDTERTLSNMIYWNGRQKSVDSDEPNTWNVQIPIESGVEDVDNDAMRHSLPSNTMYRFYDCDSLKVGWTWVGLAGNLFPWPKTMKQSDLVMERCCKFIREVVDSKMQSLKIMNMGEACLIQKPWEQNGGLPASSGSSRITVESGTTWISQNHSSFPLRQIFHISRRSQTTNCTYEAQIPPSLANQN